MKNQKIFVKNLLKLFTAYSVLIGVIAAIFFIFYILPNQKSKLSPTPAPTITTSPEKEKFCGGIAGIQCPTGFTCKLDGNYPDAGGKCIKEETVFCTQEAKLCPDGSYVGRQGPKCEFAPCP